MPPAHVHVMRSWTEVAAYFYLFALAASMWCHSAGDLPSATTPSAYAVNTYEASCLYSMLPDSTLKTCLKLKQFGNGVG